MIDLKSFQMGLAMGLSGKPLPLAKKEPIAYLYNGVRLPKLPEWDREKYPYAVITYMAITAQYKLSVFSECEHYKNSAGKLLVGSQSASQEELSGYYAASLSDTEWHYADTPTRSAFANDVKWANFDIQNEDGSIRLPASEPIPVYE